MSLLNFFTKKRPAPKGFQEQIPCVSSPLKAFILEPILTPSGLVDTEIPDSTVIDDLDVNWYDNINFSFDPAEAVPNANSWEFESGYFTVGENGEVSIDFLFDGGGYQGELAIFSLEGIDAQPGSAEFIQIAATRALSNSPDGYVVIADPSEGAKFSAALGEQDWNYGEYQGVKTFEMTAGTRFGVMLIPNGTVEQVANGILDSDKLPLFSMASANPEYGLHIGQIADVTGDGSTFVMEDLRVDTGTDRDYNDIIFQIRGATGTAVSLDHLVVDGTMDAANDWRTTEMGQALIAYAEPYLTPSDSIIPIEFVDSHQDFPDSVASHQPLVGIIDTGFSASNPDLDYSRIIFGQDRIDGDANPLLAAGEGNEHGTHVLGIIAATQDNNIGIDGINDQAPIWLGRAVGSGKWAESLVEFVDAAQASGQPHAVVNLSFDLTQLNFDGSITTRYELTPNEMSAIEYARQHGVLIVAASGNQGDAMSALGQASSQFDNIITVGSEDSGDRADYSSYGAGLDILASGGTADNPEVSLVGDGTGTMAGTSVAAAKVTGAVSQIWAANPQLSYHQVIEILKSTATDLQTPNWDGETGAGLLNMAAALHLAKVTEPEAYNPVAIDIPTTWEGEGLATPLEQPVATEFMGKYYQWAQYTVCPGDTLSAIAYSCMGYSSSSYYNFIAQYNGIANANYLTVGQQILIPKQVSHSAVSSSVATFDLSRIISCAASSWRTSAQTYIPQIVAQCQAFGITNTAQIAYVLATSEYEYSCGRNISVQDLVQGMCYGSFTGRKLSDYINSSSQDFWNARRIFNGIDKATVIAQIAERYLSTLKQCITVAPIRPPVVRPPVALPWQIGWGSRSVKLFQEAYIRIKGSDRGLKPTGNAYRCGNGWTQEFRDSKGDRFLLMLEDGATKAFCMQYGNLAEYEFMGGAVGCQLDGRGVFLGYPRSDENPIQRADGKWSVWQSFAGDNGKARIHYLDGIGSIATWGAIGSCWTNLGGANHWLGMPTRREYIDGNTTFADFQGGRIAFCHTDGKVEVLRPGEQPSWRQVIQIGQVNSRIGNLLLNFRQQPYLNNSVIGCLQSGTKMKIIRQVSGGFYNPGNRNDWYEVEVNGQRGYVAAYYIDVVSNNNSGGSNNSGSRPVPPPPRNIDEFNQLAVYTSSNFTLKPRNIRGGTLNSLGNCVWYANGRLKQLGFNSSALNGWPFVNNAYDWDTAKHRDVTVFQGSNMSASQVQVGDVAQWDKNGANHVAIVEEIFADGSIRLSESGYKNGGGYLIRTNRTVNKNSRASAGATGWPDHFIRLKA